MTLSTYKFADPFRLDPEDDEDFADDHVMGDWNPYESLGPDHDMDAYANRRTRPRQKTGAGKVLKAIDDHRTFFGEPMDDELGLVNLAQQNGTDPVLATRYNNADPIKRADMAWNQAEADKWWDSATPEQKAVQRDAAKAAKAYRTVLTGPRIGIDYTDPDTRNGFADISGLPRGNVDAVVNGSKAQRRAVLWANNADLQPWNPKWRAANVAGGLADPDRHVVDGDGTASNWLVTANGINATNEQDERNEAPLFAANRYSESTTDVSAKDDFDPSKEPIVNDRQPDELQNGYKLAQIGQTPTTTSSRFQTVPTPREKPPAPIRSKPPTIHNPAGRGERNDDEGKGWFGAPRVGGTHKGTDILANPGDPIVSPIEGKVENRLMVYSDGITSKKPWLKVFRSVHIRGTGPYKGMLVKLYYVDGKGPRIGEKVKAGTTVLGLLQNVGKDHRAPRMKPHVHVRVEWNGVEIDPATVLPAWTTRKPHP